MLTKQLIEEHFIEEINNAIQIIPSSMWVHSPKPKIIYSDSKINLGLASTCGQVSINHRFIGTQAVRLLKNTIRHELAHLIVGVDQGHNKRFKKLAMLLDVKRPEAFEELKEIESKISYKYTVIAHMVDGENVLIGGVHRKTAKYTRYNEQQAKNMYIDKRAISKFEFVLN